VSVSWGYRVSRSSVSKIVKETSEAIWKALVDEVLKPPSTEQWKSIAEEFYSSWNFPNCIGAIDGKHIAIRAPANSGSLYFNYKKTFSIILMAVCDANYCFTLVDIGSQGRHSDGGVLTHSVFGNLLEKGLLNLPPANQLPNSNKMLPNVIVGDEAFPLKKYMMRPFPRKDLTDAHKVYNYRLSRARRVIENAFGILAARWRIFLQPIVASVEHVKAYTKAAICLHNFLKRQDNERVYCPPNLVDHYVNDQLIHGAWREEAGNNQMQDISRVASNMFARDAYETRQQFMEYFNNEGSVPWQWQYAHVGDPNTTE
jgi:hypothetical protein